MWLALYPSKLEHFVMLKFILIWKKHASLIKVSTWNHLHSFFKVFKFHSDKLYPPVSWSILYIYFLYEKYALMKASIWNHLHSFFKVFIFLNDKLYPPPVSWRILNVDFLDEKHAGLMKASRWNRLLTIFLPSI